MRRKRDRITVSAIARANRNAFIEKMIVMAVVVGLALAGVTYINTQVDHLMGKVSKGLTNGRILD